MRRITNRGARPRRHHHLDVDYLVRRLLDLCLSLRAQTLAAAHTAMRTIQRRFSRRCIVYCGYCGYLIGFVSYDFSENTQTQKSAVRAYLEKRDRSVRKRPPTQAPTHIRMQQHGRDAGIAAR